MTHLLGHHLGRVLHRDGHGGGGRLADAVVSRAQVRPLGAAVHVLQRESGTLLEEASVRQQGVAEGRWVREGGEGSSVGVLSGWVGGWVGRGGGKR